MNEDAQSRPKIALCHEWLTSYGGAEQVTANLVAALGIKDVYAFACLPAVAARVVPGCRVHEVSRWGRRLARKHWGYLLPFMPAAWERVDLSGFDLVLTNSYACSNAVRAPAGAPHVSYCQTPIRYAWEWKSELRRIPPPIRPVWPAVAAVLRRQDRQRSARVSKFIANSSYIARRIHRCYGRDSEVIYPPVDTSFWTPGDLAPARDFFLFAGRLVAYKRPDVALKAARQAGVKLVIAGSGPMLPGLKRQAGPGIEFVENPSNEVLRDLYRQARAFVFPGVEDFGITFVEAQACGTPVIAFDRGGAGDAVAHRKTGLLYGGGGVRDLAAAMSSFEPGAYDVERLVEHVRKFDVHVFREAIRRVVKSELKGTSASG